MIYNIRGTSGSGKTTIVKRLIEEFNGQPILGEPTKKYPEGQIAGYLLSNGIRVVGRYTTDCGGADTINKRLFSEGGEDKNSMDLVEDIVRDYAAQGDVLFEGLIVTSVWGRWARLAEEQPVTFFFLDTPLEVCEARVLQRNGGKPFKLDNLKAKIRRTELQIPKAEAADFNYHIIDHRRAYEQILAIIQGKPPVADETKPAGTLHIQPKDDEHVQLQLPSQRIGVL